MNKLYPIPPFKPFIQNEVMDDNIDFFRPGINDSGNFVIDNYYNGSWENIYER